MPSSNENETETTLDDVLGAVNKFATDVEQRFNALDTRLKTVESQMVTKEYLDEKMAKLQGESTTLIRKEDTKLKTLVQTLTKREVITAQEQKQILDMEPFAQLAI